MICVLMAFSVPQVESFENNLPLLTENLLEITIYSATF